MIPCLKDKDIHPIVTVAENREWVDRKDLQEDLRKCVEKDHSHTGRSSIKFEISVLDVSSGCTITNQHPYKLPQRMDILLEGDFTPIFD